jgi:hypothetical protein
MKTFAVLTDNLVTNLIVANTLEIAEQVTSSYCVEVNPETPVHINDRWNGVKFISASIVNLQETSTQTISTQGIQKLQSTQGIQELQSTQGIQELQSTQGIQELQSTQGIQAIQSI